MVGLLLVSCTEKLPVEEGFEESKAIAGQAVWNPVEKCSKTDSSEFVKGTLVFNKNGRNYGPYLDKCYKKKLIEYYCEKNQVSREWLACENGCKDGACIKIVPKVTPEVISKVTPKDTPKVTAEVTPKAMSEVTYELLSPIIANHNSIANNKINMIFDCKGSNTIQCVNDLPYWLSIDDSFIKQKEIKEYNKLDPTQATTYEYYDDPGLFQIEPFKSTKNLFNFWYIDRTNPSTDFLSEDCYGNIPINSQIPNVIIVSVCNSASDLTGNAGVAHSSAYPILGSESSSNEKGSPIGLTSKSDKDETHISLTTEVSLFIHETGHSIGGLRDEYGSASENGKQGGEGFPNCADSLEIANSWWKDTGFVDSEFDFSPGCKNYNSLVTNQDSIMGKGANLGVPFIQEYFTNIQQYWICRNIYDMTGLVEGVCEDFQEYGDFNSLIYTPME